MQTYKNTSGNSGVLRYEISAGSIIVDFKHGGPYLYDGSKPGAVHVAEMQRLARAGSGLGTYINQYVRKNCHKL